MSAVFVEHSTNSGRTWQVIEILPTSLVANTRMSRTDPWHDGFGNWYRPTEGEL